MFGWHEAKYPMLVGVNIGWHKEHPEGISGALSVHSRSVDNFGLGYIVDRLFLCDGTNVCSIR